jgi:hypothetical protein
MAVVQISRIQIRRGKAKTGTGFPQLASGELGWAFDTQELYIGNGSVAEGSPAVGNTKILTQNDLVAQGNLLNLLEHVYKANDPGITTGPDANFPITRFVQDRLDDRVTVTDFGAEGDDTTDDTAALQRAIDQLFLNPVTKASLDTIDGVKSRIILEMPAGTFNTSKPLYVPSYATIVGAGSNKTKIVYNATLTITGSTTNLSNVLTTTSAAANMVGATVIGTGLPSNTKVVSVVVGTSLTLDKSATSSNTSVSYTVKLVGPAIQFINDSSTIGNPSSLNSTLGNTQPRSIVLKGLSIKIDSDRETCLQLDAVKDSVFDDLVIEGSWESLTFANSKGIAMNALSDIVTCESNLFRNVRISNFNYGVYSKGDIQYNNFDDCKFDNLKKGISFGEGANQSSIGQQYGPRNNTILKSTFSNIQEQAVYIPIGTKNIIDISDLKYVGNNGGDHTTIAFPQIYFGERGNSAKQIKSDRSSVLGLASYVIRKITLTLNRNVTASRGAFVEQVSTNASGYLVDDVINDNEITLVGIFVVETEVTPGNWVYNSLFDLSGILTIAGDGTPSTGNLTVTPTVLSAVDITPYINYIPEVAGYGTYESYEDQEVILSITPSYSPVCKLPVSTTDQGSPDGNIFYTVNYEYRSTALGVVANFVRKGTFEIAARIHPTYPKLHLSDDYTYTGDDEDQIQMEFRARFLNENGETWSSGDVPYAIEIQYTNTLENDTGGRFIYSYKSTF